MGVNIAGAGEPATVMIRRFGFVEQVSAVVPAPLIGIALNLEFDDPATGGLTVPPPAILIEWVLPAEPDEEFTGAADPPVLEGVCAEGLL
jgi:hypothetical protein